jgi:hypothetical protein
VRAPTLLVAIAASAVLAAAGCGSGGSSGSSAPGSTQPSTSTPVSSAPATSTPTTTTTPPPGAQNLVVDNTIRAQLVAAGAAVHRLTPKDYVGLVKGETYYAYVAAKGIYWAGAGLDPSPKSLAAQVGSQDDGAYMLFERHGDGPWRVWEAGIPGDPQFTCPVKVPASVVKVWDWKPGTCNPPSSPD